MLMLKCCLFFLRHPEAEEKNLRPVDPKDCVFDGIEGKVVFKTPGEIRGADFIVQNCKVISYSFEGLVPSIYLLAYHSCEKHRENAIGPIKRSLMFGIVLKFATDLAILTL